MEEDYLSTQKDEGRGKQDAWADFQTHGIWKPAHATRAFYLQQGIFITSNVMTTK